MRLIDADFIYKFLENQCDMLMKKAEKEKDKNKDSSFVIISEIMANTINIINKELICVAPTVDAVPVIRCKYCKHFTEDMAIGICKRNQDKPIIPIPYNHFCSYGEMRSENV